MNLTKRAFLTTLTVGGAAALFLRPAMAEEGQWYENDGYAADGADVVAYFGLAEGDDGVRGSDEHVTEWNGARWRFASAENLATFTANPEKYAPQFGGYCAFAVSRGYTAHGDRNAWTVHDGQLYLNFSKSVRRRWARDIPGNIAKGRDNWPSVLNA